MGRGKRHSERARLAPVMGRLADICPHSPDFGLDWPALEDALPLSPLAECPQEPVHHGEGNVLAHTKLACEALVADPAWRSLDEAGRQEVFLAALLHDIAKAQTTREQEGRLTSPGPARRGAIEARRLLWQLGMAPAARERVCALIRHHMVPYFLVEATQEEPQIARRRALGISLTAGCGRLSMLARADAHGRIAKSAPEIELAAELFSDYCAELGCLSKPYPFPSDHSRFLYFRRPGRDPAYMAYDDTAGRAIMMHGLPGAGKDAYIDKYLPLLPVVSLDTIREELGIPAGKPQGAVIQLARERAREHLRVGADFIWNATSISRAQRETTIALFTAYNARVEIVAVEVDFALHEEQNRARDAAKVVPERAIARMLERWEYPDLTECHQLIAWP